MSDDLDVTPPDPDSRGCLCVVASFVSAARTIEEVTAEAANRAMMSPVLSDFIELRFADLGPQPGHAGDRSAAIRRVTDALLTPQSIAGRSYFAVVVVDRSARVAEQVLSDCAASPFLAPLRARFLGIANSDGQPGRGIIKEPGSVPDIVTSPTGVWSRKEDLVNALRRFADELQRGFSASHEPGMSAAELDELRARYHQHTAPQTAEAVGAAKGRSPEALPGPDMLAGDAGPAQTPRDREAPDPPVSRREPAPGAQQPAQHRRLPGHPAGQEPGHPAGQEAGQEGPGPASAASGPPEPAGLASRPRRWFSELRRRRGRQPETGEPKDGGPGEGGTEDTVPKTEGLIYLLIVGGASSRDDAALNRSRSAVREVDGKLAELPGFAYRVRMLHGDEDGLRSDLRDAGQLGRRHVRRTVADMDFAALLESIRASLKRDGVTLRAATAAARPAVVFFTPEPPLADTVAAELFRDLAREASIIWALPKSARPLLSEAFTDAPGVQVIPDDQTVADEIAALLSSGADPVKTGA